MAEAVNSWSKFASQNVQAIHGRELGKGSITIRAREIGRRSGLLLSTVLGAASQVSDSRTELLKSKMSFIISFNILSFLVQAVLPINYLKFLGQNT